MSTAFSGPFEVVESIFTCVNYVTFIRNCVTSNVVKVPNFMLRIFLKPEEPKSIHTRIYFEQDTQLIMQSNPKLIYKSLKSNKPTSFPAFFYGMPDNRVYVVYLIPYKTPTGRDRNEYAVALLEEFSYDYKEELLFERHQGEFKPLFLESFVDKYDQRLKIIKKSKKIKNIFTSDLSVESFLNKCIKQVSPEPVLSY